MGYIEQGMYHVACAMQNVLDDHPHLETVHQYLVQGWGLQHHVLELAFESHIEIQVRWPKAVG